MSTEMISIASYCLKYDIEHSFIASLESGGLIEVVEIADERFIPYAALPKLERYIRWHYELDINPEGIETIEYLLYKIDLLQEELGTLRERLRVYEG